MRNGTHHPDIGGPEQWEIWASFSRAANSCTFENSQLYYKSRDCACVLVMNAEEKDEILTSGMTIFGTGGHFEYQSTVKKIVASQKWVAECP